MTLTRGAVSFSPTAKTQAEGQDARRIDDQSLKSRQRLESSVTLGGNLEAFQNELISVLAECSVGNWAILVSVARSLLWALSRNRFWTLFIA